jgi:hypothetical protein
MPSDVTTCSGLSPLSNSMNSEGRSIRKEFESVVKRKTVGVNTLCQSLCNCSFNGSKVKPCTSIIRQPTTLLRLRQPLLRVGHVRYTC